MKKILLMSLLLMLSIGYASAQKEAEIKFDKMTYDFGTFSEGTPVQKCTFTFTNAGDAPLNRSAIYQEARSAGTERHYQCDLQRKGTLPRALQEVYHNKVQRKARDGKAVHRGDYGRGEIIKNLEAK